MNESEVDYERVAELKADLMQSIDLAVHPKQLKRTRCLLDKLEKAFTGGHIHKFTTAGNSTELSCDICGARPE